MGALILQLLLVAALVTGRVETPPPAPGLSIVAPSHRLVAASDGRNVWMVTPRMTTEGVEHVLWHHAAGMGGPYVQQVLVLRESPLALAASEDSAWLVMPAIHAHRARREVYGVSVERHELTGVYFYQPRGRLQLLEGMPDEGNFGGAAAMEHALFVLRVPGVPERLTATGWKEEEGAPQGGEALFTWGRRIGVVTSRTPWRVAVAPTWAEQELNLEMGGDAPRNPGTAGEPSGAGDPGGADDAVEGAEHGDPALFRRVVRVEGVSGGSAPAVVVTRADGRSTLAYVNGAVLAPIVELPATGVPWAVVGVQGGFAFLEATADGRVAMRRIDAVAGHLADPVVMTAPPPVAGQWVHFPLMGILAISIGLGIFLVHHVGPEGRFPAPYGYAPLGMGRRIPALLIDLMPGAALVVGVGYPAGLLLQLPMLSPTAEQAVPGVLLVLITMGLCALEEMAFGTTLGKWLMGGRVARLIPPGVRPAIWQGLVRNLFKGMLLLVPFMGVLVLLAPGGRWTGDVLSGTAVIRRERSKRGAAGGNPDGAKEPG